MFDFLQEIGPIPYFTVGPWEIGPLTIYSFGLMVAIGVLLAHSVAVRRAMKTGEDPEDFRSLALYMLIAGFVGSHIINVLLYKPQKIFSDPAILIDITGSLSSYGGILGALVGIALWKKFHAEKRLFPLINITMFALPVGWFFGRIGCSLVHDHPGRLTDFPLALQFPEFTHHPGVRHDLGMYEAAWWLLILIAFFAIDKWKGSKLNDPPGFYIALLPLVYAPVRFLLDFLRIPEAEGGDARYFGLTPAQYLSVVAFLFGVFMLRWWLKRRAEEDDQNEAEM